MRFFVEGEKIDAAAVPLSSRASASLLLQSPMVEVLGPGMSGEVEPLLLNRGGALFLGRGTDSIDRDLETISVAASISNTACACCRS